MGLLDDLKKEAESLQNQEAARTQSLRANALQVDQALRKIFHYMNELFKQLNVVKPACARDYDFPAVGKQSGFTQSDYRIEYRTTIKDNKEHFENLAISFKRTKPGQFEVKREAEQIERYRDVLWQNNIRFTSEAFRNDRRVIVYELFKLNSEVLCGAEIIGDYDEGVIRFKLRNVEDFGTTVYTLEPSSVEDKALEELAKLFIGKTESGFKEFNRKPTYTPPAPRPAAARPIPQYANTPAEPEKSADEPKKAGLFGSLKSALNTDLTKAFKKPNE